MVYKTRFSVKIAPKYMQLVKILHFLHYLQQFFILNSKTKMQEEVKWDEKEDNLLHLLKEIKQDQNELNWEEIADKISMQTHFPIKKGEQCRKRYETIIEQQGLLKVQWTEAEQRILLSKHREIGNKWSAISNFLCLKNDNCVKNHFYSRLRKMIRKINRMIQLFLKKSFRSIPNTTIYKLVEASEERFKEHPACEKEVSMICQDVITKMLEISIKEDSKTVEEQSISQKCEVELYRELLNEINKANKSYKKKSKKVKNSTIKAPVRKIKKAKQRETVQQCQKVDLKNQSNTTATSNSEGNTIIEKPDRRHRDTEQSIDVLGELKYQEFGLQTKKIAYVKQGDQMQELLKDVGLLRNDYEQRNYAPDDQKSNSQARSNHFENIEAQGELQFFEESLNCRNQDQDLFELGMINSFNAQNSSQVHLI